MLLDVSKCFRDASAMAWTKADYERLGYYVVSARQLLRPKMSRSMLAEAAGISSRTLADIENGELGNRKSFSSETLLSISAVLGWHPTLWKLILNDEIPHAPDFEPHSLTVPLDAESAAKVDYAWNGPNLNLPDDALEEIEDEVEEFRQLLIRRAQRKQEGKTAGQLEREAADDPEA